MTLRSCSRAELSRRLERWFEPVVLVAAALVIPNIVIEESVRGHGWQQVASALNWTIWSVFAAEVIVLAAVAPDRRRWFREHLLEVAVVVLTPPFLPSSLQAARLVRLLRLLRLARVAKIGKQVFSLQGVRVAAFLALITVLAGGAAFAAGEDGHHDAHLTTWDGVWWAVVTITSVGYGDLFPVTTLGRIIGIVVMVVGLGFVAILTAALAERFLAQRLHTEVASAEAAVEAEVEYVEAELLSEVQAITQRLHRLEELVRSTQRPAPSRTT